MYTTNPVPFPLLYDPIHWSWKSGHFESCCLCNYRKLSDHHALWRGLIGTQRARCFHIGIEKNEKRFSWFMRCLMCLAQTRPTVQHDGGCRLQGWTPSHFIMSVFIRKSAIELPLLHIWSQWVCGLQEWKQKRAQASLNNYFLEAHEPAQSFM